MKAEENFVKPKCVSSEHEEVQMEIHAIIFKGSANLFTEAWICPLCHQLKHLWKEVG